ncbi:MAG: HD domain-containing protein [Clostridiaceae bacterium]|nr:HD domain-containing protein [Clostridiaceae bacterium]
MNDNLVQNVLFKMMIYFRKDILRINHALKVYTFAKNIATLECLCKEQLEILEISSILHDIGIKECEIKYHSSAGHYQELEGPSIALNLLKEFNLKPGILERISFLIGNHHSYDKINGIDFQILVEADFLVNIFEDNYTANQIDAVKNKYFKTQTGIKYLTDIYE